MIRSKHLSQFVTGHYPKRKIKSSLVCGLLALTAFIAVAALAGVFGYILYRGLPSVNWNFFFELPKPVGEIGGGMGNALLGSLTLVILASVIGVPWGIMTGIYLSEYGRGKLSTAVRFSIDMLSSVPSIVVGLFIYVVIVKQMGTFSAHAGAAALAILMVPTIARNTEELLKLVPVHIREAGLALGIARWRVILSIVLRGALSGITTGIMLSIARVAGETAPLLFTALNNRFWQKSLNQPIASLPVQIYTYAVAPYDDWNRQAWAGALILVLFVFSLNIATRLVLKPATAAARD